MRRRHKSDGVEFPVIRLVTGFGTLHVRLFAAECPHTVATFLRHVRKKVYQDREFLSSDRSSVVLFPSVRADGDGEGERSGAAVTVGSLVDYGNQLGLVTRAPGADTRGMTVFGKVFHGEDVLVLLRGGTQLVSIEEVSSVHELPGPEQNVMVEELPDGMVLTLSNPKAVTLACSSRGRTQLIGDIDADQQAVLTQFRHGRVVWSQSLADLFARETATELQTPLTQLRFFAADSGHFACIPQSHHNIRIYDPQGHRLRTLDLEGEGRAIWSPEGDSVLFEERVKEGLPQKPVYVVRLYRYGVKDQQWEAIYSMRTASQCKVEVSPDLRWATAVRIEEDSGEVMLNLSLYDLARRAYAAQTRYEMSRLLGSAMDRETISCHVAISTAGQIGIVLGAHGGGETEARWCVFGMDADLIWHKSLHLAPTVGPTDILYRIERSFHLLSYPTTPGPRDTCLVFSMDGRQNQALDLRRLNVLDAVPYYDGEQGRLVLASLQQSPEQAVVRVRYVDMASLMSTLQRKDTARTLAAGMADSRARLGLVPDPDGEAQPVPVPSPAKEEDETKNIENYTENRKRMLRQKYIRGELGRQQYRSEMAALGVSFRKSNPNAG